MRREHHEEQRLVHAGALQPGPTAVRRTSVRGEKCGSRARGAPAGIPTPPVEVGEELPDVQCRVAAPARSEVEHQDPAGRNPHVVGFEISMRE